MNKCFDDIMKCAASEGFVKYASPALMKFLRGLSGAARTKAITKLPSEMRSMAAYKTLAGEAANVASKIPDAGGHGWDHIKNVTKNTQMLMRPVEGTTAGAKGIAGASLTDRRVGTFGALMHDVGRQYENPVVARAKASELARVQKINAGKQQQALSGGDSWAGQHTPEVKPSKVGIENTSTDNWHSETGARYVDNMLKNNPLSKYVPELRQNVPNLIRVHDTDAHAAFPEMAKKYLFDPSRTANRAVYAADKLDGLGLGGVVRTGQTGRAMGQQVSDSVNYGLNKNMGKYQGVVDNYIPAVHRPHWQEQLNEYEQGLKAMGAKNQVPESAEQLRSWVSSQSAPNTPIPFNHPSGVSQSPIPNPFMKAANLQKMLRGAKFIPTPPVMSYEKLFRSVIDGTINSEQFRRVIRSVASRADSKIPTGAMRKALKSTGILEYREGLLNGIQQRDKPSTGKIMSSVFPTLSAPSPLTSEPPPSLLR